MQQLIGRIFFQLHLHAESLGQLLRELQARRDLIAVLKVHCALARQQQVRIAAALETRALGEYGQREVPVVSSQLHVAAD